MKLNKVRFAILTIIGRLLKLQGSVTTRQVKRRAIEIFGERDYIKNQVQVVLKHLVEQNVLERISLGVFQLANIKMAYQQQFLLFVINNREVVLLQEVENHPVWVLMNFDKSCLSGFHRFNLGMNQVYMEVA